MMKKIFIFVATMLIIVSIAVVSCKKDNLKETKKGFDSSGKFDSIENMDTYLLSFKNKLLNATKNYETIDVEQAERDLGNLLNFDFGDANHFTNIFQYDTLHFCLSTLSGQVSLINLAEIYQSMLMEIPKIYQSVTFSEKSVYCIFCEFLKNTENNAVDTTMVEIVVVTRGCVENSEKTEVFGNWRPQNRGGTCTGFLVGVCGAPEILKGRLDSEIGDWTCENGRVYFTNEQNSYIDYHARNMYDSINDRYRLYVSYEYDQNNVCLSSNLLQYYYDQARLLPTDYFNNACDFYPQIPNDHVIIGYLIEHMDSDFDDNTTTLPWYWWLIVTHAKLNCTGNEIEGL
jgi:hypothetical protein